MVAVFRLADLVHIFIMSFILENICCVFENNYESEKVYYIHLIVTKLLLDGV